jgi:hypothetical protein
MVDAIAVTRASSIDVAHATASVVVRASNRSLTHPIECLDRERDRKESSTLNFDRDFESRDRERDRDST